MLLEEVVVNGLVLLTFLVGFEIIGYVFSII
jgi:hypothetical protein